MTLADLFNSATEFDFEGKVYRFRQPTLEEQGEFQRYLEQQAWNAIERRTYADLGQQDRDRNLLTRDIAAGYYEWGGIVSIEAAGNPKCIPKLMSIIGRDQGVTLELAERMLARRYNELAATVVSKVERDPFALAPLLATLGLPSDFLSSHSPTLPSESHSPNSGSSPTTNCSESTPGSSDPLTGTPRLTMPEPSARPPTPRQAFERYCFLNAITEPEVVAKLWAEKCAKEGSNGTPETVHRGRR